MAIYDEGGMGAQPVMGGGGALSRKPRKGGSAAAMPGQMTNTAMPGTQQLSAVPQGMEQGANFAPMPGQDASAQAMQGSVGGYGGPMGSGTPLPGLPPQDPGMAGSLGEQPVGTPLATKPGKMGGAAAPPAQGGIMPPSYRMGSMGGGMGNPGLGIGSMIKNRVGALRNRGRLGGGMGGGGY
jgi:hypothetical protein